VVFQNHRSAAAASISGKIKFADYQMYKETHKKITSENRYQNKPSKCSK
jgi:hypothetical protein